MTHSRSQYILLEVKLLFCTCTVKTLLAPHKRGGCCFFMNPLYPFWCVPKFKKCRVCEHKQLHTFFKLLNRSYPISAVPVSYSSHEISAVVGFVMFIFQMRLELIPNPHKNEKVSIVCP